MATVLSTLYPPLIDTFMPAFPYTGPASVDFSISSYNSWQEIKYMHITLVNQKTNQNAFMSVGDDDTPSNTFLSNGIWIVPFSTDAPSDILIMDTEANKYTLNIPASLLKNQNSSSDNENKQKEFVCDYYYKVQIRFDCCVDEDPAAPSYLTTNRAYFSEWSSVCLLKAIPNIKLNFVNFTLSSSKDYISRGISIIESLNSDVEFVRVPQYTPGIIPFSGNLKFAKNNIETTTSGERLQWFNIKVYDNTDNLFADSGKIYVSNKEEENSFYWLCDMTNGIADIEYTVSITCTTNNQFSFTKDFHFKLIETSPIEFNLKWDFNKKLLPANGIEEPVLVTCEDGLVNINIEVLDSMSPGYLFIKRASSKDSFKKWDLIDCSFMEDGDNIFRSFTDRTVGSLVRYKYSCQYLTQKGSWTKTVYSPEIVYPDFYDILISRGNKQLAIRYNEQIASFTPVVNRVKIDTLGGRYPRFAENAKLNYKQFNLTGLIIAESDYNRQFLDDRDYYDEMKIYDDTIGGRYMIRNDTVSERPSDYQERDFTPTYNAEVNSDPDTPIKQHKRDTQKNTYHDIYPMDNWWWEREFREEAIKWLNDGEPKLYRSMTEGNLIVMFDSISLTPNAQLGRRAWNFSATVYEVGDGYSLEQLDSLGIYPIHNEYNPNSTDNSSNSGIDDSDQPGSATILRKYISQQYQIQDNSGGNGTPIVIDGPVTNRLNWLYTGLYSNYTVAPNSIKLRDVKIQFDSLPQWYDLDTLNPYSPSAPLIEMTLEDGTTKIVKIVQNTETKEWEKVDLNTNSIFTTETISEWLSEWERSKDYDLHGGNVLIKVDLRNNLDSSNTTVTNTEEGIIGAVSHYIDNITNKLVKKNYGLGYKLQVSFSSPYNTGASVPLLTRTIFVNEKGYYQIPSNLEVRQIILYDGAIATMDYILEYGLIYDDKTEPDSYEVSDTVVGQISGTWLPNTNIVPIIKGKYNAEDLESYYKISQTIDSWKAISFDMTPYSIIDIKAPDESYTHQVIVGRTGALTLESDYPTNLCIIRGKRMIEAPFSRLSYLDDWEYVLDASVREGKSGEDATGEEPHWWALHSDDSQDETDILVKVQMQYPFDDSTVRSIIEDWFDLDSSAFFDRYEIKEPKPNTIYGLINDMGFFEYKIYYQDHGWYNVTFPNIDQDDYSIAYAQVPVYGMINYKANITKKLWLS